jgi:hypothetical protein
MNRGLPNFNLGIDAFSVIKHTFFTKKKILQLLKIRQQLQSSIQILDINDRVETF